MSTNPANTIPPTPIDPSWALPPTPTNGCPVSAPIFARLCDAAKRGGWEAVWSTWAEGQTVTEINQNGKPYQRPAKRRTLGRFLEKLRPDLRIILEECAQEKRSRLLSQLENVAERVALGPPDTTTDYDSKGNVVRVRTDSRNRNYMVLALLKANDRDKYGDQRNVKVDGAIDHRHAHAHLVASADQAGGYRVDPEAIEAALNADERLLLMGFLERIEQSRMNLRREESKPALPGRSEENTNE